MFDFKEYDSGKWYFQYLHAKHYIESDHVIFKTGTLKRIINNVLFFTVSCWLLYQSFKYSLFLGFPVLWICVLFFVGANKLRYLQTNKLKIDSNGFVMDDSVCLYWENILHTIVINYKFNRNYPVNCLYIILRSGVWYKIDFYRFEGFFKNYKTLPIHIEYFKEKYEQRL